MDIDYKIVTFFREFIQEVQDFETGKTRLIKMRNNKFLDKLRSNIIRSEKYHGDKELFDKLSDSIFLNSYKKSILSIW